LHFSDPLSQRLETVAERLEVDRVTEPFLVDREVGGCESSSHETPIFVVGDVAARHAQELDRIGEPAAAQESVQRRKELAAGEVSGTAEDHEEMWVDVDRQRLGRVPALSHPRASISASKPPSVTSTLSTRRSTSRNAA